MYGLSKKQLAREQLARGNMQRRILAEYPQVTIERMQQLCPMCLNAGDTTVCKLGFIPTDTQGNRCVYYSIK